MAQAPVVTDPVAAMSTRVQEARAEILKQHCFIRIEEAGEQCRSLLSQGRLFTVPLGDGSEVLLRYQFGTDMQPLQMIGNVLQAFNGSRSGWSLAHWFASGNGWIQGSPRPVDALASEPDEVLRAAQMDAMKPGA